MVKPQGVEPPFIYNVVHRRPIVGVGAGRQPRHHVGEEAHAVEMAEQEAGVRVHPVQGRGDRKLVSHKATGSRGVHHELGSQRLQQVGRHDGPIAVLHTRRLCRAHKVMVHVGAEPVGVGEMVVRARGDQQPLGA